MDRLRQAELGRLGDRPAQRAQVARVERQVERLTVEVSRRNGTGVVAVADEGIGIPPDEQARIFEKFYRLDPSMTRGVGGSGLGLYIIRELVTQMGGDVAVDSELGRGSIFTISLPLR